MLYRGSCTSTRIVAYINGVEVYRDNMPEGAVSAGTMATGGYSTYDYHSVYTSASGAESASVLAVELHFTQTGITTAVQFNAYLAFGAGNTDENKCYVAPLTFSATGTSMTSVSYSVSWTRNSLSLIHI